MSKFWRYLRIAFSATCLIVAVLLCVLWVRSYWVFDQIIWNSETRAYALASYQGRLTLQFVNDGLMLDEGWSRVSFWNSDDEEKTEVDDRTLLGFGWQRDDLTITSSVPFWFLVLTCVAFPFLRWRFSLRTLLIAMTLVAAVLGLFVWLP